MRVQQHFMPHGTCYLWNPQMLLLQGLSDAGIAFAYFSISILLLYFLRRRGHTLLGGTIAMFATFVVAGGATHVMAIWTIWHPAFWLDGSLKALTAVVSLTTAVMLVPLMPKALALRTSAEDDLRERLDAASEAERQYKALAEALPQIVWTAEPDGGLDYYNGRWFDYTGLTLEQTRGWGWEPVLHPDDLTACMETWRHSLTHGTPYEVQYRFKRASDGAYRWHLGRALPIRDAAGSITKWFGTCTDIDDQKLASEAAGRLAEQTRRNETLERDIVARKFAETALRASDERFKQVEQNAPIGLALIAPGGTFTRVNPALCVLTGYDADELTATTSQALTHPEDLDADLALTASLLRGAVANYEIEKRYFHKDGHTVWISSNVSLVCDDAGQPLYFISQIQDITARKAAEQDIKVAQKAALTATEAKSRFLATMSHEIRTPMNGIIGMAELLALTKPSEEQNEYIKVVRESGQSLLRVLNDILDYSKIEAGKLALENVDFDLGSQIRSVVALLEPQFQTKGVSLETEVSAEVPPGLRGDPGRVRQILINLVGNALKFTPAGGRVRILVAVEATGGETVTVRFTIVDSGAGIAPEVRHRLFKPFSQLDGTTTRKHGGTGLGLSICRQLVDLMEGKIGVDSTLGLGSSFWFGVPFSRAAGRHRVLDAPRREMGERRGAADLRPEKVLLAEDNAVNTLLAIKQFERLGFGVTVAADGREAVAALKRERFDIVFMDCHMPEIDGLEATRQIRQLAADDRRRVPIVAMTADAQAEDRAACLASGMDDYVSKPVSLADIAAILMRWLPQVKLNPPQ